MSYSRLGIHVIVNVLFVLLMWAVKAIPYIAMGGLILLSFITHSFNSYVFFASAFLLCVVATTILLLIYLKIFAKYNGIIQWQIVKRAFGMKDQASD